MITQTTILQTFTQAAAVLIATAVVSSAEAAPVAYGDFDNDGLIDVAAITSPTAITISLANPDGSYTVSAILVTPQKQPITDIGLGDHDGDGNLDVNGTGAAGRGRFYTHMWSGNGDGTFGSRTTVKWSWPPKGNGGGF